MITRLRRAIALAVAAFVTVLTLGRVKVEWSGVGPMADSGDERGAVTSVERRSAPKASADTHR